MIIAEEYLDNKGEDLPDYKFFCFNGKPEYILLCQERFSDEGLALDFYSSNWEWMDFLRPPYHPHAQKKAKKPEKILHVFNKEIKSRLHPIQQDVDELNRPIQDFPVCMQPAVSVSLLQGDVRNMKNQVRRFEPLRQGQILPEMPHQILRLCSTVDFVHSLPGTKFPHERRFILTP